MLTNYTTARVHLAGLEPATSRFEGERSIQLSYKCIALVLGFEPRLQSSKLRVLPLDDSSMYPVPDSNWENLVSKTSNFTVCSTGYTQKKSRCT